MNVFHAMCKLFFKIKKIFYTNFINLLINIKEKIIIL